MIIQIFFKNYLNNTNIDINRNDYLNIINNVLNIHHKYSNIIKNKKLLNSDDLLCYFTNSILEFINKIKMLKKNSKLEKKIFYKIDKLNEDCIYYIFDKLNKYYNYLNTIGNN